MVSLLPIQSEITKLKQTVAQERKTIRNAKTKITKANSAIAKLKLRVKELSKVEAEDEELFGAFPPMEEKDQQEDE